MNALRHPGGGRPPGLQPAGTLLGPGSRLAHAAWSPDGEAIAASFVDGTVQVWRAPFDQPAHVLEAPAGAVEHLAWSPDGQTLAAGRRGPLLRWRLDPLASGSGSKGKPEEPLAIGEGSVSGLTWSPDGASLCAAIRQPLAGGLERFSLRRYRTSDGRELESVERAEWGGAWLAVSADRGLVGLSLESHVFELWDLRRLQLVRRFPMEYRRPRGVALAPDGETIAVGYGDGSVWMWSARTGERLRVLQIHEAAVYSLDFSHDQSLLASKSLDGTVRLRLCEDWRKGAILPEPASAFESEICFHPKRLRLATHGDFQTSLRLWDLDPGQIRLFGSDDMIGITFFSANAADVHLKVDEELREIQDHLAFARLRDQFDLTPRMAVQPDDFIRFLSGDRPRIVHFSGHGSKSGALLAQGEDGKPFRIGAEALEALFRLTSDHVECVVLNACHAAQQGRAIARHVRYVVGMSTTISDGAAIAYSKGFYQALGNGLPIEKAHEAGKTQILLYGRNEGETPVLLRREEVLAQEAEAAKAANPALPTLAAVL